MHFLPKKMLTFSETLNNYLIYNLRHHGLEVPRDLAIVGFDGVFAGQHVQPRLTTLRQPCRDVVRAALKLALELNGNAESAPRRVRFTGTIDEGESVLQHHQIHL